MSFLYTDLLFLRIYYKDSIRKGLHLFDTAKVLLKFIHLFSQSDDFFLRQYVEGSVFLHGLDCFQSCNTSLDSLEVGQHTTEPSLVYIVHSATLCLYCDSILSLFLSTNEKDLSTLSCDICNCFVSLINFSYRFLQVDDVDTVSLGVDVLCHLRVPSSGLMTEVYAGFQ